MRKTPKHALVAERQRNNRRRGVIEDLEGIFGEPPLLQGEDELAYLDLASRIRAAMLPRDVIEEIYARVVADLQWDILRGRRRASRSKGRYEARVCVHFATALELQLSPRLQSVQLFFRNEATGL